VVLFSNSSSTDKLSAAYSAHQPDVVTNTICHEQMTAATTKLHQLEKCHAMVEKQLVAVRAQLQQRTLGFEAMIVLVKRLSEESCPVTVSRLNANLVSLNNALIATSAKCDILVDQRNALIAEIQNIKEEYELEVNALNVTHEMALQANDERLENRLEMCLVDAEQKRISDIAELTTANERMLNELKQSHQKAIADKEQEFTSRLIDLEFTHKRKIAELQRKHDGQVKELEQTKASLTAKLDQLKQENERIHRLTSSTQSLSSVDVDSETKCPSPTTIISTLSQEIDSLKIVVDVRNAEVLRLKTANAELEKQVHELSAARERIRILEQKLENAEAIVSMKSDYERELAEKHKMLLVKYDQESKESKRLSMDREQLMWRLNNDGLAAPPAPAPTTPSAVRRTISNPAPTKSAPGTPLVTRRTTGSRHSDRASAGTHRPLSQGDFNGHDSDDALEF
jgi:myosin heavy subunit